MYILVFANGQINRLDWLRPFLQEAVATIAADGGARHVLDAGYQPDVIVGDMDSLSVAEQEQFRSSGVRIVDHPVDKNETDLELALTYAIKNYETDILIMGALGGRLDQTLANIMLLADVKLSNRRVEIREEYQRAWLVEKGTSIRGNAGDLVSLIPIENDVHIVETTGLKWPLRDEILTFSQSRGISNVLIGGIAEVTLKSGRLICVISDGQHID